MVDEVLRVLSPDGESSTELSIPRPATEEDLYQYIANTLGVRIPRLAVKPGHSAPWAAFCNSYFARTPVAVWLGARGLAGKTFLLAVLGWVEAVTLRANVSILGGSGDQSEKVLEYLTDFWLKPGAPSSALESEPAARKVRLVWGNKIRALTASQKQARGGHPERLRLDEADEMDWQLLQAVLGQPMSRPGIDSQTTISSTHHYAEGTMTKVLGLAQEKGWPVYQWGYHETVEPHGWLTHAMLARKRQELTTETWRVEVEMEEPSTEGRAILTTAVEAMFTGPEVDDPEGKYFELEAPDPEGSYATGADWAKESHMTVLVTWRDDVRPVRLVAYEWMNRRPYPEMIERLNVRLQRYGGRAAHDRTGVGTVIEDYIEAGEVIDLTMVGRARTDLFDNYIGAIERGEYRAPRFRRLYNQHKFVTTGDLRGTGHPPDGLVAGAMGHHASLHGKPIRVLFAKDDRSKKVAAATEAFSKALSHLRRNGNGAEAQP